MKSEQEIEMSIRDLEIQKQGIEQGIKDICEIIELKDFLFKKSTAWVRCNMKIETLQWVLTDKI